MSASVRRGIVLALSMLLALAAGTGALVHQYGHGNTFISDPIDFLAFDCAAKVGARGADPYLTEPLRSCERDALAESGLHIIKNLVVPAPLPPYALAALAPLGLVSFLGASALWFSLSLVAVGATIVMLRRLTKAPLLVVTAVVLTADAFASLPIGQMVPIVLCALCGAALALRSGRPQVAALLTAPLMLEPHVGLPAALALFIWEPRTRRTLAGVALVLGGLSLLEGLGRNVEYLRVVLPEQARGEGLEFGGQYSLSALLVAAGVPSGLALGLGSASYVFMAGCGVALAGRVAAKLEEPAAVLLLPPAFAVVGGTYVHIHQMAFTLPVLLLLLMRRPRLRVLTVTALLALAVPWETLGEIPGIGPAHRPAHRSDIAAQLARVSAGNLPAEEAWGVWVRSGERDSRTALERLEFKLPTWFGLALVVAASALVGREPDGASRSGRSGATLRRAPRSA